MLPLLATCIQNIAYKFQGECFQRLVIAQVLRNAVCFKRPYFFLRSTLLEPSKVFVKDLHQIQHLVT